MSAKKQQKTDGVDAVLDQLAPVFQKMEADLRAAGWRRRHGRLYSRDGKTLAAFCLQIPGDRNGKH